MKKRLGFSLIVICLLIGMTCLEAFAQPTEFSKIKMLSELQILPEALTAEKEKTSVNKALFVQSVVAMMQEQVQSDAAVDFAKRAGWLDHHENEKENITVGQALTILVKALGYEPAAAKNNGVLSVAVNLGLKKGINAANASVLNLGDMVSMLYQAVNTEIPKEESFSAWGAVKVYHSGETLLSKYRKIYKATGTVNAAGIAALYDGAELLENQVMIGDTVYDYRMPAANDFLGMYVEAYVKIEDDENTLLYMGAPENKNKEAVIAIEQVEQVKDDFTGLTYYDENNRLKTAALASDCKVILNGKLYADYQKEDFLGHTGTVRLLAAKDSAQYNVVFIHSYDTFVVNRISNANQTIYNEYQSGLQSISFEDKAGKRIYMEKDGQKFDWSQLKPGDVLNVAKSKSKGEVYYHILVSSQTITAQVQKLVKNPDGVLVEDKEYPLSQTYLNARENQEAFAVEIKAGEHYMLYLDSFGKVAAIKKEQESSQAKYVFINSMVYSDDDNMVYVSCLDIERDEWITIPLRDTIRFNGIRMDGAEAQKKLCGTGNIEPQLMEIKLSDDKKVTELKTAAESREEKPDEFIKYPVMTKAYRSNNQSFDYAAYLNEDAKIVFVPEDEYDKNEYYITTGSGLVSDMEYTFTMYNFDEYKYASLFVAEKKEGTRKNPRTTSNLFVVTEKSQGVNTDQEVVDQICGTMGNYASIQANAAKDGLFDDLQPGDVIFLNANNKGEIDYIDRAYAISSGRMPSALTNLYGWTTLVHGDVKDIDTQNNRVKLMCESELVLKLQTRTVTFYDQAANQVTIGTIDDVETDDFMIVKMFDATVTNMIVIRFKE